MLLNRSHRQQYEEMILRLNPLIVRLELQLMKTVLAGKKLRLEDVIDRPYSRAAAFRTGYAGGKAAGRLSKRLHGFRRAASGGAMSAWKYAIGFWSICRMFL